MTKEELLEKLTEFAESHEERAKQMKEQELDEAFHYHCGRADSYKLFAGMINRDWTE